MRKAAKMMYTGFNCSALVGCYIEQARNTRTIASSALGVKGARLSSKEKDGPDETIKVGSLSFDKNTYCSLRVHQQLLLPACSSLGIIGRVC
jgi:hypothetical protein